MNYDLELKILTKYIELESDLEILVTKITCQSISKTLVIYSTKPISSEEYSKLLYQAWQSKYKELNHLKSYLNSLSPSILVPLINNLALTSEYPYETISYLNDILKLKKERRK